MHNSFANIVKILEVCKRFSQDFVNNRAKIHQKLIRVALKIIEAAENERFLRGGRPSKVTD